MLPNWLQTAVLQTERIQQFPLNRRRSLFPSSVLAPSFFCSSLSRHLESRRTAGSVSCASPHTVDLAQMVENACELAFQLSFYLQHCVDNPFLWNSLSQSSSHSTGTAAQIVAIISDELNGIEQLFQEICRLSAQLGPNMETAVDANKEILAMVRRTRGRVRLPVSSAAQKQTLCQRVQRAIADLVVRRVLCCDPSAVLGAAVPSSMSVSRSHAGVVPLLGCHDVRTPYYRFPWAMLACSLSGDLLDQNSIVFRLTHRIDAIVRTGRALHEVVYETPLPTLYRVGVLEGHRGQVRCLLEIPQRRLLASGGDDKTILLWDLATGLRSLEGVLVGHTSAVQCMALVEERDGNDMKLLSGGTRGEIILWSISGSFQICQWEDAHRGSILWLLTSSDLPMFFSAGEDGEIQVWCVDVAKTDRDHHQSAVKILPRRRLHVCDDVLFQLHVSVAWNMLLAVSGRHRLLCFDLDSLTCIAQFPLSQTVDFPLLRCSIADWMDDIAVVSATQASVSIDMLSVVGDRPSLRQWADCKLSDLPSVLSTCRIGSCLFLPAKISSLSLLSKFVKCPPAMRMCLLVDFVVVCPIITAQGTVTDFLVIQCSDSSKTLTCVHIFDQVVACNSISIGAAMLGSRWSNQLFVAHRDGEVAVLGYATELYLPQHTI